MLRYFFALILLAHGLIHFMGFAKAFNYGNITQVTKNISKPAGTIWLITALLFIISVSLFLFKKDWWWIGFPAILFSQVLIFMVWKDAKFGTIANILALLVAVPAYADWKFSRNYHKETTALLAKAVKSPLVIVNKEMLKGLPPPVQRWLERSGIVGKEMIHKIEITQSGEIKQKPGAKWFPFKAKQYNTTDPPAFAWKAQIHPSPLMFIDGRDKYEEGRGNMLVKPFALFTAANAKGVETDQGSMLRYLGEIGWFPSAALNNYIRWEPVDWLSAKATMTYGGITASGIFHFNADGDITGFEAMRYYVRDKGKTSLERWVVTILPGAYKEFEGIRIPSGIEVAWKLDRGDFTWLKLEMEEVRYDE
ncbi:MAG: hypothetical protein Q8941_03055 [Bacteroidota bacterium]|nr:hypothetical protein [Bacteroidota bacterium]